MMAGSQTPEDTGDAGQELRENASLTATPEAVGSADISDDIEILDEGTFVSAHGGSARVVVSKATSQFVRSAKHKRGVF
eukprot:SAG31_NODE_3849_length_3818_cov_3.043560_1_plen_79_part_00